MDADQLRRRTHKRLTHTAGNLTGRGGFSDTPTPIEGGLNTSELYPVSQSDINLMGARLGDLNAKVYVATGADVRRNDLIVFGSDDYQVKFVGIARGTSYKPIFLERLQRDD